jgi:flagellar assembly factor FliW
LRVIRIRNVDRKARLSYFTRATKPKSRACGWGLFGVGFGRVPLLFLLLAQCTVDLAPRGIGSTVGQDMRRAFWDCTMPGQEILTTRFGSVAIEPGDGIYFPLGISGLSEASHWVLLAEARNDHLGWLQSTVNPELALAVVNPRRFVKDFSLRVNRADLEPLGSTNVENAHVLVIVSKHEQAITLNLRAPLLIHMTRRIGTQVVNIVDLSVQHALSFTPGMLRKSA